jgi:hypothetical protein
MNKHQIDTVAGHLARWIQDREFRKDDAAPALMSLSKNSATINICLLPGKLEEKPAGLLKFPKLPNHYFSDAVLDAADHLDREIEGCDLKTLIEFEGNGMMDKGDMEQALQYAAQVLHRTAELVADWRRVEAVLVRAS